MSTTETDPKKKITNFTNMFDTYRRHPRMVDYQARLIRNQEFTSGLGNGQWFDKDDKAEAEDRGIVRRTLNLILPSVEQIVGDLMTNPCSVSFMTDSEGYVGSADLMTDLFDADYNLGKYRLAITEFIRDTLVHTGVLQLYVNYKYSPKGNIGLRRVPAQDILFDPYWTTDDTEDCPRVFRAPWASIEQIFDLCSADDTTSEQVRKAYENFQKFGAVPGSEDGTYSHNITSDYVLSGTNQFRLVECIYMVQEKVSKVVRIRDGKEMSRYASEDKANQDMQARKEQLLAESPAHQNSIMYRVDTETLPVCRIFTMCPGLDDSLIIEDAWYPIQMGSLPFIIKSSHNHQGNRQGIVDMLIDPQVSINKRESSADEVLDKTARGNIQFESDAFGDDAKMEKEYSDNMNKTGQMLKVAPGALNENKIREVKLGVIPTDLWNAADRSVGYLERILGLTAARQGESKSHDSALLFSDQVAQAEIKLFLLNLLYSDTLFQLGNMYFFGAKDLYRNDARRMLNPRTGKVVVINTPKAGKDGKIEIENDISSLPRFVVKVEQSKHGLTVRKRYLGLYTELLDKVKSPMLQARCEAELVKYLGVDETTSAKMEEECEIFVLYNKRKMEAEIANFDLTIASADAQRKQIQNPPAQPAPQGVASLSGPVQSSAAGPQANQEQAPAAANPLAAMLGGSGAAPAAQ